MPEKADVIFYKGHGWVKVGEIEVSEDGSFTGKLENTDPLMSIPEMITIAKRPFIVAVMMPEVSIVY
jgi:hypothetical protein